MGGLSLVSAVGNPWRFFFETGTAPGWEPGADATLTFCPRFQGFSSRRPTNTHRVLLIADRSPGLASERVPHSRVRRDCLHPIQKKRPCDYYSGGKKSFGPPEMPDNPRLPSKHGGSRTAPGSRRPRVFSCHRNPGRYNHRPMQPLPTTREARRRLTTPAPVATPRSLPG